MLISNYRFTQKFDGGVTAPVVAAVNFIAKFYGNLIARAVVPKSRTCCDCRRQ
jgi:hypothetical protein